MKDLAINETMSEKIDKLEEVMVNNFPPAICPVNHIFTENIYTREIFMPAGSLITSKIHKTQHPFFVLAGKASVWIDEGIEQVIEAPYRGITEPGTRRVLFIWEDCIWATVHYNPNNENEDEIVERITEKHDNPHLSEEVKNRIKEINLLNNKMI
jgi:hypothetical protein